LQEDERSQYSFASSQETVKETREEAKTELVTELSSSNELTIAAPKGRPRIARGDGLKGRNPWIRAKPFSSSPNGAAERQSHKYVHRKRYRGASGKSGIHCETTFTMVIEAFQLFLFCRPVGAWLTVFGS
jgi:hypothetical protein